MKTINFLNRLFLVCIITALPAIASQSICQKFSADQVKGQGPLPFNYRLIDYHLHAGGHPLNPWWFRNSDEETLSILSYLKSKGVEWVIDLENTKRIQTRYAALLQKAGLKRLHIPMTAEKVPTESQWLEIKARLNKPVYIHCQWGADRTGAIIGRYLVEEKGYPPIEAWRAVISGGSHAGALGGLKEKRPYANLVLFFFPEAQKFPELVKKYF